MKFKIEPLSIPTETQHIALVIEVNGRNLFLIELSSRESFLVQLPSKFNNLFWIKRGQYCIIEIFADTKGKVKGEIIRVLYTDDVKELKKMGVW